MPTELPPHLISPFSYPILAEFPASHGILVHPAKDGVKGYGAPWVDFAGEPIEPPGSEHSKSKSDVYFDETRFLKRRPSARFWKIQHRPGFWVYGNIDWIGKDDNADPVKKPGAKHLSYWGPQSRYFPQEGFRYGKKFGEDYEAEPKHQEIYYRGYYQAVAPAPVLGACFQEATKTDPLTGVVTKRTFLMVLCFDEVHLDEVPVYVRAPPALVLPQEMTEAKWNEAAEVFHPEDNPTGWIKITTLYLSQPYDPIRYITETYELDTPFFFNRSGTEMMGMVPARIYMARNSWNLQAWLEYGNPILQGQGIANWEEDFRALFRAKIVLTLDKNNNPIVDVTKSKTSFRITACAMRSLHRVYASSLYPNRAGEVLAQFGLSTMPDHRFPACADWYYDVPVFCNVDRLAEATWVGDFRDAPTQSPSTCLALSDGNIQDMVRLSVRLGEYGDTEYGYTGGGSWEARLYNAGDREIPFVRPRNWMTMHEDSSFWDLTCYVYPKSNSQYYYNYVNPPTDMNYVYNFYCGAYGGVYEPKKEDYWKKAPEYATEYWALPYNIAFGQTTPGTFGYFVWWMYQIPNFRPALSRVTQYWSNAYLAAEKCPGIPRVPTGCKYDDKKGNVIDSAHLPKVFHLDSRNILYLDIRRPDKLWAVYYRVIESIHYAEFTNYNHLVSAIPPVTKKYVHQICDWKKHRETGKEEKVHAEWIGDDVVIVDTHLDPVLSKAAYPWDYDSKWWSLAGANLLGAKDVSAWKYSFSGKWTPEYAGGGTQSPADNVYGYQGPEYMNPSIDMLLGYSSAYSIGSHPLKWFEYDSVELEWSSVFKSPAEMMTTLQDQLAGFAMDDYGNTCFSIRYRKKPTEPYEWCNVLEAIAKKQEFMVEGKSESGQHPDQKEDGGLEGLVGAGPQWYYPIGVI